MIQLGSVKHTGKSQVVFGVFLAVLASATIEPVQAASRLKTLGTDVQGDGPSGLDITYLKAARVASNLEIRIGLEGMLPVTGSYPSAVGVEWIFQANERTFLVEAIAQVGAPTFLLFELVDGQEKRLPNPTGTFDTADGFIRIMVPLDVVGAKKGVVVSGDNHEGPDILAHIDDFGAGETDFDVMETTKVYRVP